MSTARSADSRRETFAGSAGPQEARFAPFRDLPPRRPEAPALPRELLPPVLRRWLGDIAERMQVPLELAAVPALVGLASAVGRRVGIHPKAQDDWLVVLNLWGGIIARPGRLKSPTLAETLKPVRRLATASRQTARRAQRRGHHQAHLHERSGEGAQEPTSQGVRGKGRCGQSG